MTHLNYRRRWEDDDMTYHNMRYVKFGPNGGAWQEHKVSLTGPPPPKARKDTSGCWLCNAPLKCRQLQWTRPPWMRQVRRRRVLKQGERAPDLDGYAKQVCTRTTSTGEWKEVTYTKSVVEPPSQLPMGVYFCRNKCDDDDELRSILKSSHTGPAKAVRVGDGYYPLPG